MSSTLRPLLTAPAELVSEGRFNLGTYGAPIRTLNFTAADLGLPLPAALKRLRLKEWQHYGIAGPEHYLSLALFDAKSLALAQVCLFERRTRRVLFYERQTLSPRLRLPDQIHASRAAYAGRGFRLSVDNGLDAGRHTIELDLAAQADLPPLHGHFTLAEDCGRHRPIEVCLPLSRRAAMWSHKNVVPAEGQLHLRGQRLDFDPATCYGLVDVHKGLYPWVMRWHWATAGGRDRDGRLLGFNLTDNQVADQDSYNENCLWLDGRLHLLPPVRFTFDPAHIMRPWAIRDAAGAVDLTFVPEALRTVDINALLLVSRYRGPFGSFHGSLADSTGERLPIEGSFGMCEDFYLRA